MYWRMPKILSRRDTASGLFLFVAALSALIIDNSSLAPFYDHLLALQFSIMLGDAGLSKPLLLWVNDGLMTLFFLLVGMEIKREVLQGKLSSPSTAALPVIAAVGGMAVPAGLYLLVIQGTPELRSGWGDTGGDRHRVRPGRARDAGAPDPGCAQDVSGRVGNH